MQQERNLETESLTKAVYYLNFAKNYLDDFRRDCKLDAKNKAQMWVSKVDYVLREIYNSLTPISREIFIKEIAANPDPIFMEAITGKILKLDNDRRDMLETVVDGLLKGEEVNISHH